MIIVIRYCRICICVCLFLCMYVLQIKSHIQTMVAFGERVFMSFHNTFVHYRKKPTYNKMNRLCQYAVTLKPNMLLSARRRSSENPHLPEGKPDTVT